jgi:hypothetical protein
LVAATLAGCGLGIPPRYEEIRGQQIHSAAAWDRAIDDTIAAMTGLNRNFIFVREEIDTWAGHTDKRTQTLWVNGNSAKHVYRSARYRNNVMESEYIQETYTEVIDYTVTQVFRDTHDGVFDIWEKDIFLLPTGAPKNSEAYNEAVFNRIFPGGRYFFENLKEMKGLYNDFVNAFDFSEGEYSADLGWMGFIGMKFRDGRVTGISASAQSSWLDFFSVSFAVTFWGAGRITLPEVHPPQIPSIAEIEQAFNTENYLVWVSATSFIIVNEDGSFFFRVEFYDSTSYARSMEAAVNSVLIWYDEDITVHRIGRVVYYGKPGGILIFESLIIWPGD